MVSQDQLWSIVWERWRIQEEVRWKPEQNSNNAACGAGGREGRRGGAKSTKSFSPCISENKKKWAAASQICRNTIQSSCGSSYHACLCCDCCCGGLEWLEVRWRQFTPIVQKKKKEAYEQRRINSPGRRWCDESVWWGSDSSGGPQMRGEERALRREEW